MLDLVNKAEILLQGTLFCQCIFAFNTANNPPIDEVHLPDTTEVCVSTEEGAGDVRDVGLQASKTPDIQVFLLCFYSVNTKENSPRLREPHHGIKE